MCVSYHTHARIYVCRQPSLPQPAGQTNSWPRSTALSPSHTLTVTQSKGESTFEDSQTHSVYSILKCTRHIPLSAPASPYPARSRWLDARSAPCTRLQSPWPPTRAGASAGSAGEHILYKGTHSTQENTFYKSKGVIRFCGRTG